jgi:hypothetical protein
MAEDAQIMANEIREKVERGRQIISELAAILRELPDSSVGELLGTGLTDDLLKATLDPLTVKVSTPV